jgi:hypothetical protein
MSKKTIKAVGATAPAAIGVVAAATAGDVLTTTAVAALATEDVAALTTTQAVALTTTDVATLSPGEAQALTTTEVDGPKADPADEGHDVWPKFATAHNHSEVSLVEPITCKFLYPRASVGMELHSPEQLQAVRDNLIELARLNNLAPDELTLTV